MKDILFSGRPNLTGILICYHEPYVKVASLCLQCFISPIRSCHWWWYRHSGCGVQTITQKKPWRGALFSSSSFILNCFKIEEPIFLFIGLSPNNESVHLVIGRQSLSETFKTGSCIACLLLLIFALIGLSSVNFLTNNIWPSPSLNSVSPWRCPLKTS